MTRRKFGDRSICKRCDLEIEFHGDRCWMDRGRNTKCSKTGFRHVPND